MDNPGWGTLTLAPLKPLFMFDWVNLTAGDQAGVATEKGKRSCEARFMILTILDSQTTRQQCLFKAPKGPLMVSLLNH